MATSLSTSGLVYTEVVTIAVYLDSAVAHVISTEIYAYILKLLFGFLLIFLPSNILYSLLLQTVERVLYVRDVDLG